MKKLTDNNTDTLLANYKLSARCVIAILINRKLEHPANMVES